MRNVSIIAGAFVIATFGYWVSQRETPPAAQRLGGADAGALVAGRTLNGVSATGNAFMIAFSADGAVEADIFPGDGGAHPAMTGETPIKQRGAWWVEADRLCVRWRRWNAQAPTCYVIEAVDGQYRAYRNGRVESEFTVIGGG